MSKNEDIYIEELAKKLLTKKKAILIGTLFIAAIVILFKVNVIGVKNSTSQVFMIKIPETVDTEYGVYKLFNTRHLDHLTLLENDRVIANTIEDLDLKISKAEFKEGLSYTLSNKNKPDESTNVMLYFSADFEQKLDQLLPTHIDNFVHELNRILTLNIINFYQHKINVRLQEVDRLLESEKLQSNSLDSLMEVLSAQPIFNSFDGSLEKILEVKTESKVRLVTLESEKIYSKYLLNQLNEDIEVIKSDENVKGVSDVIDNYVQILTAPSTQIVNYPLELLKISIYGLIFGLIVNSVFWSIIIVFKKTRKAI